MPLIWGLVSFLEQIHPSQIPFEHNQTWQLSRQRLLLVLELLWPLAPPPSRQDWSRSTNQSSMHYLRSFNYTLTK